MNKRFKFFFGAFVRIAITVAILLTVIFNYSSLVNIDVRAIISGTSSQVGAISAVLAVYGLKSVLFVIPASLIYLSVGVAFDFLPAMVINAAGIFLEINLTYFLGVFLGGKKVEEKLSSVKAGQKIMELRDKKTWSVFVIRLLPACPIDFVSLFLGASKMNYGKYILVSFFGILPRVILISAFGSEIYNYISKDVLMALILFAVVGASVLVTAKYIKKHKNF